MKVKSWIFTQCILLLLLFPSLLFSAAVTGQSASQNLKAQVDLNTIVKEIISVQVDGQQQTLGLWTPTEFFVAFAHQDSEAAHEKAEKELAFLNEYILIIVNQQLEQDDGTRVYAKRSDITNRVTLKIDNGEEFRLAENVPPKVEDLVENARRQIARNGGQMKSAHILIFSATTDGWKTTLDTTKRNTLVLSLKEGNGFRRTQLVWKTPFDASNPIPPCSKCSEPLSVKWSYCPWCGHKIEDGKKR